MTRSTNKWADAYKDSRWQKLRLQVMERDGWKCKACGRGDGDGITLNVHHSYYESGTAPWEYPMRSLVTYCEECHKIRHEEQKWAMNNIAKKSNDALVGMTTAAYYFGKTLEIFSSVERFGMSGQERLTLLRQKYKSVDEKIAKAVSEILIEEFGEGCK